MLIHTFHLGEQNQDHTCKIYLCTCADPEIMPKGSNSDVFCFFFHGGREDPNAT